MKKITIAVLFFIGICGCSKPDTNIYNNYNGKPIDSTGYLNIAYSDFSPDIVLDSATDHAANLFSYYDIDIDNSGGPDFSFGWNSRKHQIYISNKYQDGIIIDINCYQIDTFGNYAFGRVNTPSALDSGFLVQAIVNPNLYTWDQNPTGVNAGTNNFPDHITFEARTCSVLGKEIFIGIKSSKRNFGWMRLSISTDGKVVILKDYAYNIIPNTPLRVGDK